MASESSKWISVSDFEASKADWTPTVESVTYHAEKAKNEFDADLKLLVGGDTLNGFGVPGLWEANHIKTILSHGMVCICRSGNDPEAIISAHSVLGPLKDRIILVGSGSNFFSSFQLILTLEVFNFLKHSYPENKMIKSGMTFLVLSCANSYGRKNLFNI